MNFNSLLNLSHISIYKKYILNLTFSQCFYALSKIYKKVNSLYKKLFKKLVIYNKYTNSNNSTIKPFRIKTILLVLTETN